MPMAKPKIMIVEDDRILAMGLQIQLNNWGYDVPAAVPSGEQALRQAEAMEPDLILMDIQIEGSLDGIETAYLIRQKKRVPIIFLTAYSTREMIERANTAEPAAYLIKPYDDRELRAAIERALKESRGG